MQCEETVQKTLHSTDECSFGLTQYSNTDPITAKGVFTAHKRNHKRSYLQVAVRRAKSPTKGRPKEGLLALTQKQIYSKNDSHDATKVPTVSEESVVPNIFFWLPQSTHHISSGFLSSQNETIRTNRYYPTHPTK